MSSRVSFPAGTPTTTTYDRHSTEVPRTLPHGEIKGTRTVETAFRARWKEVAGKNAGMLLIGAAQVFFALMNVGVKVLNQLDPPVPALELVIVRMAITWICCIVYMLLTNAPDVLFGPKGIRLLIVFRGVSGFISLFSIYYGLEYLSLSDTTVLQFLAPMCTAVAGAFLLKETFTIGQAIAGVCSLVGVMLIARPEFLFSIPRDSETGGLESGSLPGISSAQRLGAVGVVLVGVLGATGAYVSIRALGTRAHLMHNIVAFCVQCVALSTILMWLTHTEVVIPWRWDWLGLLFMIGIFGFVAQILQTLGLQRETAGRGTIAVYAQIIFAATFEFMFFHTTPSILSILGTIIIVLSALYVVLLKEREASSEEYGKIPGEDVPLQEVLLEGQDDEVEA